MNQISNRKNLYATRVRINSSRRQRTTRSGPDTQECGVRQGTIEILLPLLPLHRILRSNMEPRATRSAHLPNLAPMGPEDEDQEVPGIRQTMPWKDREPHEEGVLLLCLHHLEH